MATVTARISSHWARAAATPPSTSYEPMTATPPHQADPPGPPAAECPVYDDNECCSIILEALREADRIADARDRRLGNATTPTGGFVVRPVHIRHV